MRPPDRVLRREIVHNLSRRIPLDTTVQEHIVRMTEGYTPAQVQEVVYGLVIQQGGHCRGRKSLSFTVEEVNTVLRRINHRNSDPIGFRPKDIYTTSGDGGISYPR
jgi:hypothetical protein